MQIGFLYLTEFFSILALLHIKLSILNRTGNFSLKIIEQNKNGIHIIFFRKAEANRFVAFRHVLWPPDDPPGLPLPLSIDHISFEKAFNQASAMS